MPWTTKDVDRFKKGLSDAEKDRWVKIANGALASCMKKGGDELDCEVKAVKQANGSFDDDPPDLANFSNPIRPNDHNEPMRLALADVDEDDDEKAEGYQLAFPIGAFKTSKYGEVIITRTFAEMMRRHWEEGVLGNRAVFMDTEHDFGEACAWAEDMRVTDEGLEVKWDFNSKGRELVADRRFRYYSAAIGWALNLDTGEEYFPVLHCVSLTNRPVMNTMPEAHLSDTQDSTSAHGDGGNNITGGESTVKLAQILLALFALKPDELSDITDEDKAKIADLFGFAPKTGSDGTTELAEAQKKIGTQEAQLKLLLDENKDLSKQLADYKAEKHDAHRNEVIEKALDEGKILPKNREKWEGMFDKDPEGTAALLAEKGAEIDLSEHGTGAGGNEGASQTADDEHAAQLLMQSDPTLKREDAMKAVQLANNGGNE